MLVKYSQFWPQNALFIEKLASLRQNMKKFFFEKMEKTVKNCWKKKFVLQFFQKKGAGIVSHPS